MRTLALRWETLLVGLFLCTLVLAINFAVDFVSAVNFSQATTQIMEKAIVALALTLIIVVGEIDLSVASMMGLASAVLGRLLLLGVPLGPAIAICLLVGALGGLVNGLLVTRLGLPSLVVTLGTLALYRGLAFVVLGSEAVSEFPPFVTEFGFGSVPRTLLPWSFVVFVVLLIPFMVVLHRSWIGRQLYAIGNNEQAASFSGVRVNRLKVWLFVTSGLLSALAGLIYTGRLSSARADNALGFELDVITAVLLGGVSVFGGRGTLFGVVVALFLIAIIRNALGLADYSGEIQSIAVGGLLIFSVLATNALQTLEERSQRRRQRAASRASPGTS